MTDVDAALTGGNYEVLRTRLATAGGELATRSDALNLRRKALFGSTEPQLVATERVRTEHNCTPCDIIGVGGDLLVGYNAFLGLKAETKIGDVLALHRFVALAEGGYDTTALPQPAWLAGGDLERDFGNLYRYYRDARLMQLVKRDTQILAVFQAGVTWKDIKVLRWRIEPTGAIAYVDDRGDRDYAALFPTPYEFAWVEVTRDHQVTGKHPHYNLLDTLFVECVHGDLTIKVENNTDTGEGIYAEPVDDANQSLDDARVFYAAVGKPGGLVLLKILPFRETVWRYLIFDTRSHRVIRADGIGQGCRELPEDHGVVFPGGYMLVGGEYKLFDGDATDYVLEHEIKAPNGEDVLYEYFRGSDGTYLLYAYNLVDKAIGAPIACSGYSLFADGQLVIMRGISQEPTRVHPMQVWRTPFTSAEHAASAPTDGSYLGKVGNADLVRGLSDAFSIARLAAADKPQRSTFEDILALATRATDAYYWLGHADTGDLKTAIAEVRATAKLILDEYEKVLALEREAKRVLAAAETMVAERLRDTRSEHFERVEQFLTALTGLRGARGELITKQDTRFIDKARLAELEKDTITAFERVTADCVAFLAKGNAFADLVGRAGEHAAKIATLPRALDVKAVREEIDQVATGVDLLGNVIGSLKIDDTTTRTAILENITDAFGQVNRARATIEARYRELAAKEGRAEFGAQIKLLTQAVASSLAQCDTPERCDQELTRLLVQLEELEGRFADIDELIAELAEKRVEIVEAVGARKQVLAAERQRRAANLVKAAQRILEGVARRATQLATAEEVNAYFASDAMVQKLRDIGAELGTIGDGVKADELAARLKTARQDALRGQRDKADLFEGGGELLRFGEHRFTINTQPLELMIVPQRGAEGRDDVGLALHLTGTDFYEPIVDPRLEAARHLWDQDLPSESAAVYRGEYLAASILAERDPASLRGVPLEPLVRQIAQERYDEGYERGVHDDDAAKILEKLLAMRDGAGLLAYAPDARALATMYWAWTADANDPARTRWHRAAQSLARLAAVSGAPKGAGSDRGARAQLIDDMTAAIATFAQRERLPGDAALAAAYLVLELASPDPRFVAAGTAVALVAALHAELDGRGARTAFEDDVAALGVAGFSIARAWIDGIVAAKPQLAGSQPIVNAIEAAAILTTPKLARVTSSALVEADVTGLLGRHPRIVNGTMVLRLDEAIARLDRFRTIEAPAFRAHRQLRQEIGERERKRLRIDELKPKVISSFVRNRLIDQVYLPLVGANLAKQLGAAGANKRTDQMGMLLLVSPPGYGKTTLMEYVAARMGLAFVKVNGPALGHGVTSLDPADAPNATARQEIEKVGLALEMGTNVMLYLDDIQHTSPELLQKFISLCDAQRKIEGVWKDRTRTYDLRGKKFCVVMAGNPYTESGETFRIPDMLANRADVYNLGDVLTGKGDAFALSFLENALTSSATLAPLATRELADVHAIIRMAKGEPVPTTELVHGYSAVELAEITTVMKHLFVVQETLLRVNQEYIRSAAQADAFRTEPPFKLQGSYRNMNKIAEKVVAAMTATELDALVSDHYRGESQTLTTAAEQNLLKLAELRGRLTPEQAARWTAIKTEYVRQRRMGGGADDPVTRLVGTISGLGSDLKEGFASGLAKALEPRDQEAWLGPRLDSLAAWLSEATKARAEEVRIVSPPVAPAPGPTSGVEIRELVAQVRRLEQSLVPVANVVADARAGETLLANKLVQIIELLEQLDAHITR